MKYDRLVARAAKRYGLNNPSVDDILMEVTPRYHADPVHTELYHALLRRVLENAENVRACENCGGRVSSRRARFCCRLCWDEWKTAERMDVLGTKQCVACGATITPTPKQDTRRWRKRRYCTDCGSRSRYL